MLRTLYTAIDNVVQLTLASGYTPGSGQVVLSSGGSDFTSFPAKFTIIMKNTYAMGPSEVSSTYSCTGVTGNTLTGVTVLPGSVDQSFPAGSYLEVRANAIDVNSLNDLVAPLNNPGANGFQLVSAGPTASPFWAAGSGGTGGGGAPLTSKYILQQTDASLPNAQAIGLLATGLMKVTTATGVISTATATDIPDLSATYQTVAGMSAYLTTAAAAATYFPIPGSKTQSFVYAAPSGANGVPVFRLLVANDIPNLDAAKITTGTVATARIGSGTANATTFLRGDSTWQTLPASGAPTTSKYIVQGTVDASLTGAQFLGALATGIVKNTITTGILSIATGADIPNITESQVTNLVTDLAAKAPLISPALTGTPTAPTATFGTNTTQLATTAFVLGQGFVTTATAPVQSVAGKTGAVTLVQADIGGLTTASSPAFTGLTVGALSGTLKATVGVVGAAAGSDLNTTFGSQTQNFVYSAPSAAAGVPSFRLLVTGDIPVLDAAKITTGIFATARIPDLSATYQPLFGSQTQNFIYSAPSATSGVPSFRLLVAADIPNLDAAKITTGTVATARLGSGTANNTTFLRGDGIWAVPSGSASSISIGSAITGGTNKSVLYVDSSLFLAQDNLNFSYDPVAHTLTVINIAGSGTGLTALNASNLSSGTVATARLGSGTANTTTFLRGDSTWQTIAGGAPAASKYIVQGTTDAGLTGAQFLGALATGIVKNTTTTGILSIAIGADIPNIAESQVTNLTTDLASKAPTASKYIVQGTIDAALTGAQFLGSLTTGLLKNTTSTGILSIAIGSDIPNIAESQVTNLTADLASKAPTASKYIVQGTVDAALTGAQFLGALATGIVKSTTSTGILSIATGADIPNIAESQVTNLTTDLAARELIANKGALSGYASLDSGGKIPTSQLPASVVGAVIYQGVWNASTNTPTITSGVGTKGWYYKVSVAGSTLIDGISVWAIGDWIIYNGATWDKVDNSEVVTSVAGKIGAVTLVQADIGGLTTASSPVFAGVTVGALSGTLKATAGVLGAAAGSDLNTTFGSQTQNFVHAAPSGSAGVPGFRLLVAGDIPNIAESQVINLVTDLAAKAPLASPALTGTPSAPTATAGTNTTQLATTAFVLGQSFITAATAPVTSVATRTGAVVLAQADIAGLTTASSPVFAGVTVGALSGTLKATAGVVGTAAGSDLNTTFGSQTQNFVYSAPSGASGVPSFRLLVAGDIPVLDASKITTGTFATARIPDLSATYQPLFGSQTQNFVYSAPSAANGVPAFRLLVAGDIPALDAAKITTGTIATARLGSGTANTTTFLRGDSTWQVIAGGAPAASKYIVQGTTDAGLTGAQFLGALTTGLLKNTTTTGILSIATGTDIPNIAESQVTNLVTDLAAKAPTISKYIVQGTTDASLTGAQFLGALATGIVKNTITTGVLSIAVAGTDYLSPTGDGSGLINLNASSLTTGTVPIGRLGTSGVASSSTFFRGDNSWQTIAGGAPAASKYIVQGTTDAGLTGAQFLGALGTGLVKNTTSTGILSIAIGSDIPNIAESQVTNLTTDLASKAPTASKYIIQGTVDAALTGAQFLGALATGIVKNTVTTGILSIATGADIPNITESQVTNLVTDLAAKAPLASPALTGTPSAPTATAGTNTTQLATTAFVLGQSFITSATAPVTSVATRTGAVVLAQADIAGLTTASAPQFAQLGVGIAATPYLVNLSTTLARGLNITQTGTTSTSYGAVILVSGAAVTNIGISVSASGGTTNTAISVASGTGANDTAITTQGRVKIAGNANVIQLSVLANATQTANIQEWQNNSGALLCSVNNTGVFTGSGAGLTTLNASSLSSGTVPAACLPNPSATTLGGIQSIASVANQWIDSISTSGVPHLSQPAFSDISGTITTAQVPNSAITYAKIQNLSAVTLLGNPTGSAAAPSETTLGDGLSFSGTTLVTTGPHLFTAILGQGAVITTGTNAAGNYLICPFAGTFTRWDMAVPSATQPSGASLVIDVLKSSDHGSTWTSLWAVTPANRPTITTGINYGGGTSFDTTTYAAGDWLRFDVITAGGGAVQYVTVVISSRMGQ